MGWWWFWLWKRILVGSTRRYSTRLTTCDLSTLGVKIWFKSIVVHRSLRKYIKDIYEDSWNIASGTRWLLSVNDIKNLRSLFLKNKSRLPIIFDTFLELLTYQLSIYLFNIFWTFELWNVALLKKLISSTDNMDIIVNLLAPFLRCPKTFVFIHIFYF